MNKSLDERLFEQLMRAPHAIRKTMLESRSGGEGPKGPGCRGGHRFMPPRGPEAFGGHHGPEAFRGHCGPEGPRGPMGCRAADPGREHGPGGHHGNGHAFMRERLLGVIAGYEGGVRQKTLTEELRINPSSVSEMISKLQNDGYVERTVDPEDKRATLIVLTELGEARAAELEDERQARFANLFGSLTVEEKEQLIALLEKLTAPAEAE